MKWIAIDVSTEEASVAVGTSAMWLSDTVNGARLQAKRLLPLIDHLVRAQHWTLPMIDAIAFGCGPGSFTGLRVAASVAQGLGVGLQKPLVAVSSLAILAQTAYRVYGVPQVCATFDARMQEIYAGYFGCENGLMRAVEAEQLLAPTLLRLREGSVYVGPGVHAYAEMMEITPQTLLPCVFPQAGDLILLAADAIHTGAVTAPADVSLHYLRNTVVHKK